MCSTKRKRLEVMRETTWAQCGLTKATWTEMLSSIAYDITEPENIIGLEGLATHGERWHQWYNDFLNGPLKQRYWSASSELGSVFADRFKTISAIIRPLVAEVASFARDVTHPVPSRKRPVLPLAPEVSNQFEVLGNHEIEEEIQEVAQLGDEGTSIANANTKGKSNEARPHSPKPDEIVVGKDCTPPRRDVRSPRAAISSRLKGKAPLDDGPANRSAAKVTDSSETPKTSKEFVDSGHIIDDTGAAQRSSYPTEDKIQSVIESTAQTARANSPSTVTKECDSSGLSGSSFNKPRVSPMSDVEYSIVNSPITKIKEGDWSRASRVRFNWRMDASGPSSQATGRAGDPDEQSRKNETERDRKRHKSDQHETTMLPLTERSDSESRVSHSTSTKVGTLSPRRVYFPRGSEAHRNSRKAQAPVLGPVLASTTSGDNATASTRRISIVSVEPEESQEKIRPYYYPLDGRLRPISHVQIYRDTLRDSSSIPSADENSDNSSDHASSPTEANRVANHQNERGKALMIHPEVGAPVSIRLNGIDRINTQPHQNLAPPIAVQDPQNQLAEDLIATTAAIGVDNYLVPYSSSVIFPPLLFASTGISNTLGTVYDYRFHHCAHAPAFATFLQELHERHGIPICQRITMLKVSIQGTTMHIEIGKLQGTWDWLIAMDIALNRDFKVDVRFELE